MSYLVGNPKDSFSHEVAHDLSLARDQMASQIEKLLCGGKTTSIVNQGCWIDHRLFHSLRWDSKTEGMTPYDISSCLLVGGKTL